MTMGNHTAKIIDPKSGKTWNSIEEYHQERPIPWWRPMYWWIKRKWDWIDDKPRFVRHFWQRGCRGWSNRDTWSFDYHLSRIIVEGISYLREKKHGAPADFFTSGVSDKEGFEAWDAVLSDMIYTFETAQKIIERDWFYIPTKEWREDWYQSYVKMAEDFNRQGLSNGEAHAMTRKECEKYELGFQMFQKHFFGLWD